VTTEVLNVHQDECPFCGLRVYFDDANSRVLHAEPECSEFAEACGALGSTDDGSALVLDLEELDGEGDA